jgi:hypothetical protein
MHEQQLRAASISIFDQAAPGSAADGARTWVARGANFVITWSAVHAGAAVERTGQADEYFVYSPDAALEVRAGTECVTAGPGTVTIVPAGASQVKALGDGGVLRFFSSKAGDLAAQADNASEYQPGHADTAPLEEAATWLGPGTLRNYPIPVEGSGGSRMRIFRSQNLMINFLVPRTQPRDVRQLTPHAHAEFEQGSFALCGDWIHHLRYPWTANMHQWRPDDHVAVPSPSLAVIPPKVIHTSRSTNQGLSVLIDLFAPPRPDFLQKAWVLNASEYRLQEQPVLG